MRLLRLDRDRLIFSITRWTPHPILATSQSSFLVPNCCSPLFQRYQAFIFIFPLANLLYYSCFLFFRRIFFLKSNSLLSRVLNRPPSSTVSKLLPYSSFPSLDLPPLVRPLVLSTPQDRLPSWMKKLPRLEAQIIPTHPPSFYFSFYFTFPVSFSPRPPSRSAIGAPFFGSLTCPFSSMVRFPQDPRYSTLHTAF